MALQALGGGIEPVRARPGMFIGDTQNPTHLAEEILDNAIDEIANGYGTVINIFNNIEDNSFWVSDNGRGIPIEPMTLADGSVEDSVKVLCTELFSGTKFDTDDYAQLIGMHGVGLVAVNALSDWLTVKTRDRKNRTRVVTYSFIDGELQQVSEEIDNDFSYSTVVGFKPSKKYFGSLEFDNRYFVERLISVQSIFDLNGFTFNNKPIPKLSFESYIKQHLALAEEDQLFLLSFSTKDNSNHIKLYATYVDQDDSITLGNVNLRACDGKFINSFHTELKKSINEKIDKSFSKMNDREYLNGLRAFIMISVPEPKFDSQTKVRMVLDVKKILIDPLKSQLDWFVEQIIDTLQSNLERKLHQKILNSSSRSAKSNKRVSISKLHDCQHIPGDVLYIVEGDSAEGTLKQITNKKIEACYPLKGKVLNVETSTLDKIQKNKEIGDLLKALGSVSNRRYKSIKILADADSIGAETPIVYIDKSGLLKWNFIKDIDHNNIEYVLSLDNQGNIEYQKVLNVIKHRYSKKEIFRIKSRMGHYIDCTEDHVVYVYNRINEKINEKSPLTINTLTDYLICPKEFPTQQDQDYTIDITKNIINNDVKNKEIRNKFKLTKELAYLVGFYIGDRCCRSNKNNPFEVTFSYRIDQDCERRLIESCRSCKFQNFVIDKVSQTSHNLKVKSIEFDSILNYFGLTKDIKAKDKFVPQLFFSCSKDVRLSLLMGVFHSNECLFESHGRFRVSHRSISRNLQIDLNVLLRQFGIIPILQEHSPKDARINKRGQQIIDRHNIYTTSINSFETFDKSKLETGTSFKPIQNNFLQIKIESIEKIPYNYDFVYDLEVENNNNFAAGTLGAIYHNSDGQHISVLVLLAIAKFAPDYIKSGNLSVIIPPLYGAEKGGKYYPIYDQSKIDQFKKDNYKIRRFKGLGEMNPNQLEACIRSGFEYKVKWPDSDKQLNNLISIITNTDLKRAIMNSEGVKMDVILAEVNKQFSQKTKTI